MDKGKPKVNKTTPVIQNRNNVKGQGTGNQQNNQRGQSPQQKKPQQNRSNPNNLSPAAQPPARPPLQRHHTSKTKTPLRQPKSLETKTPPPSELRKSVDVRVTENLLVEQQPGMALLTPHGRYRHHSRVVAYIDIVVSIIHMIYVVISIGLMFNVDTFVNDTVIMVVIIFGALTIIFIFFELCIAAGLLKSTDPQLNRYDAMEKAGCWRFYEFFMSAFSIVYGSLSIHAGYPVSGIFALVLVIMRCVGIIIVFQFIRDLDRQGDQNALLLRSLQAKKRQNHPLLEVVSGMPNAY